MGYTAVEMVFYLSALAVRLWLLNMESWVQLQTTSYEIQGGQSDNGVGFSPSFSSIALQIIIPLLLHLSLPPQVSD